MSVKIGHCFKDIRIEKNFTQTEMANIVGISRKQYWRLENEEIKCQFDWIVNVIVYFGDDVKRMFVEVLLSLDEDTEYLDLSDVFLSEVKALRKNMKNVSSLLKNEDGTVFFDEKSQRNIFYNYLRYKANGDIAQFKKFFKTEMPYVDLQRKYEALPMVIPTLSPKEISTILDKLKVQSIKNTKKIDTTYVYIFLNGIGDLLKTEDDTYLEKIEKYLENVQNVILQTNHHYLLPIYYRHAAVYYLLLNDQEQFIKNKDLALQLSDVFQQKEIHQHILSDFD